MIVVVKQGWHLINDRRIASCALSHHNLRMQPRYEVASGLQHGSHPAGPHHVQLLMPILPQPHH